MPHDGEDRVVSLSPNTPVAIENAEVAAGTPPPEGAAASIIEGRSPWRLAYERLRRDRASLIALGVVVVIILVAIFAPVIAALTGHGVYEQFRSTGLTPDGL